MTRLAQDHTAALWQGEGENLPDTPPGAPSISASPGIEQMPKKYLISYIIELGPGSLWGSFQAITACLRPAAPSTGTAGLGGGRSFPGKRVAVNTLSLTKPHTAYLSSAIKSRCSLERKEEREKTCPRYLSLGEATKSPPPLRWLCTTGRNISSHLF